MPEPPSDDVANAPIDAVAQRVLDEGMPPEERAALLRRLAVDSEACDAYVDYMVLHAALRKELDAASSTSLAESAFAARPSPESEACSQTPLRAAPSLDHHRCPPLVWTLPVGTIMAAVAVVATVWWMGRDGRDPLAQFTPPVAGTPVAYLASATGCEWGQGQLDEFNEGQGIDRGQQVKLLEGVAEFRLASGVSLSIEGPAELVVRSPTELELEFGRLTAHVPWAVAGFRIESSAYHVTACDAEFGVDLSEAGMSVHAFSGQAFVAAVSESHGADPLSGDGIQDDAARLVVAGRSIDIRRDDSSEDTMRRGDADESLFATRLFMADELPISTEYVDRVMASEPVCYWRFESQDGGVVANEVSGGPELAVVGQCRLSSGAGNSVAELGRPGMNGFLSTPIPTEMLAGDEYAVEVWIKPSHFHRAGVLSMLANEFGLERAHHAFYLELEGAGMPGELSRENPSRIRVLHRNPPGTQFRTGTSLFSRDPYVVRRWQHVVAVKQGPDLRMFVDKAVVAAGVDESQLTQNLTLLVGQTLYSQRAFPFVGQIDELSIYNRALTESEVAGHYDSVWATERDDVH